MLKKESQVTLITDRPTKQRSITETYSPFYRRKIGKNKKNQETLDIHEQYKAVQLEISRLEQGLDERMKVHQEHLIQMMKEEIKNILKDLKTIIKVYNKMICTKNLNDDLWETRNQVQFFKSEAERLYKENGLMKKKVDLIETEMKNLESQLICNRTLIKKLKYKNMKQKYRSQHKTITYVGSSAKKQEETIDGDKTEKEEEQNKSPKVLPNISHPKIRCVSENKLQTRSNQTLKNRIVEKPSLKIKKQRMGKEEYISKESLLNYQDQSGNNHKQRVFVKLPRRVIRSQLKNH